MNDRQFEKFKKRICIELLIRENYNNARLAELVGKKLEKETRRRYEICNARLDEIRIIRENLKYAEEEARKDETD